MVELNRIFDRDTGLPVTLDAIDLTDLCGLKVAPPVNDVHSITLEFRYGNGKRKQTLATDDGEQFDVLARWAREKCMATLTP